MQFLCIHYLSILLTMYLYVKEINFAQWISLNIAKTLAKIKTTWLHTQNWFFLLQKANVHAVFFFQHFLSAKGFCLFLILSLYMLLYSIFIDWPIFALIPDQIGIYVVFVEGGKPDNPEKNSWSKARTNNKLYRVRVKLVGGECSHHCTNSASYGTSFLKLINN